MSLSAPSDENVPSSRLLSLDSYHQKGEAALMYHQKGSFAGANGDSVFNILIGKQESWRVE
jgi:hypothetical protein